MVLRGLSSGLRYPGASARSIALADCREPDTDETPHTLVQQRGQKRQRKNLLTGAKSAATAPMISPVRPTSRGGRSSAMERASTRIRQRSISTGGILGDCIATKALELFFAQE